MDTERPYASGLDPLFAGRRDGLCLVSAGELLVHGQRLHVAGTETLDRRRDGAYARDPDDLHLRFTGLDAVSALQRNTELCEAFVRPAADLVAYLRLDASLRPRT